MEKQARIGVAVIILRTSENTKSEVLIGKRKGSHGEGLYSVPGGHLEFGETYKDACSRELEEEIGISFDTYEKLGFSEDFFKSDEHYSQDKQYTTLYFLADGNDIDQTTIKNMEPDKCEEWIWKDIKELPLLFCDTNIIISEYMNGKTN